MTKWTKLAVLSAASAVFCASAITLRAEDKPADATAGASAQKEEKPKSAKPGKLVMPWREINSLSDAQKQQIHDIHKKTSEEKKKLEAKEREEIMALLSDEQKAEAKKIEDDKKVNGKIKSGEKADGKAESAE